MSPDRSSAAYWRTVESLIDLALAEDLPGPDLTSSCLIGEEVTASAAITARENLTVSGLSVAERVFLRLDPEMIWRPEGKDGDAASRGNVLARLAGNARAILAAERTALNFLQHLSGIATATAAIVKEVDGTSVQILDTRKTLPGWRLLEKQAVLDGGGRNHRFSLSDGILIKDNHIALAGGTAAAVAKARKRLPPKTRIEVEVETLSEMDEAVSAGADVILFDNADIALLEKAAARGKGRVAMEASGGIHRGNARSVAATGVGMISMGCLTHSSPAVDISLDILESGS